METNSLKDLNELVKASNLTLKDEKMSTEVISKDFAEKKKEPRREVKLTQLITQQFKDRNGELRYNIYGLGTDGAMYKKMSVQFTDEGRENRGWIRQNMDIEFSE